MKKVLLVSFLASASLGSFAQIKNDKGTFTKPGKGDIAVETQMYINTTGGSWFSLSDGFLGGLSSAINPDNFDYVPATSGGSIKVRRFTSDKCAQRFSANLSVGTAAVKNVDDVDGDNFNASAIGLALSFGQEKHFSGAERLSTYIGWDASFGVYSLTNKDTYTGGSAKVSQTAFGIGVKGVTGMDYYIIPKVYLGVELGYGLQFNSLGKLNETVSPGPNPTNAETASTISFTPSIAGAFRLGYRF